MDINFAGDNKATIKGNPAPAEKLTAEKRAACKGRAERTSVNAQRVLSRRQAR